MNYSKGELIDEIELLSVEPIFKEVEKIVLDRLDRKSVVRERV